MIGEGLNIGYCLILNQKRVWINEMHFKESINMLLSRYPTEAYKLLSR